MTAPAQYKIATVADVLALTPEQRVRFAIDFTAWIDFVTGYEACGLGKAEPYLVWVDDNRIGEISAVNLHDNDGKPFASFDVPAVQP